MTSSVVIVVKEETATNVFSEAFVGVGLTHPGRILCPLDILCCLLTARNNVALVVVGVGIVFLEGSVILDRVCLALRVVTVITTWAVSHAWTVIAFTMRGASATIVLIVLISLVCIGRNPCVVVVIVPT